MNNTIQRSNQPLKAAQWCGTKSEPVVSCDGVYSDVLSKRFDSDVEGFRIDFNGG